MPKTTTGKFPAFQLREKIIEMFGGSPAQYKALLATEKLTDKRALEGKRGTNLSLALTCVIFFIVGASSSASVLILSLDVFTYALICLTMSMMLMGIWMIPYFDILLSPIHYPVVAHTPVSSRTYFLVKLTQVLTHTLLLLGSLNLTPAIVGIWIHVKESSQLLFVFPLVYLPIAFMSGFFTIGVMTIFAGYLAKLYTRKHVRNIAQYAQFIFPTLFSAGWILFTRVPSTLLESGIDKVTAVSKGFYALPNGWFAGAVSLAVGEIETRFLILTGLAIVSTLFLVFVPLRNIAKSYSEYLSYLLESGHRQKSELRVKVPVFARMFRNPVIRAGFCLGAAHLYRDRLILRQLFAMLGSTLVIVVVFAQDGGLSLFLKWIRDAYAIGFSPGFSMMSCFFGIGFIGSFISPIRYSEHWKAAWMLTLAPLSAPSDLWRGVQAVALLYIVAPWTFLMFGVATVLWGASGLCYVLPSSVVLLYYVIFHSKPGSGVPLALEFVQKQRVPYDWMVFIGSIVAIGGLVGVQFLAYRLNIWVYYGLYCVMVVAGFIGWIHFFRKQKES